MKEEILLKLIEKLLDGESMADEPKAEKTGLEGRMVIVRCRDAGVHYGELDSVFGRTVRLKNTRRMWRWWAKKQMTLSAVAEFGLNKEKDLRIQNALDFIVLLDACEIIPCSGECVKSIDSVEPYDEQ